jgi:hypothetical protein
MQTFGLTSLHIILPLLFETIYIACHNTYKNYVILITKFCNYEKPNTDSKRHTNLFAHTVCLLMKIYVPSKFLAVKELPAANS